MCERVRLMDTMAWWTPISDRGDQELSKTFSGLKIGALFRKLQAFKDLSFFDFFSMWKWWQSVKKIDICQWGRSSGRSILCRSILYRCDLDL